MKIAAARHGRNPMVRANRVPYLPNFMLSDITSEIWDQLGWQYLHHRNWQMLHLGFSFVSKGELLNIYQHTRLPWWLNGRESDYNAGGPGLIPGLGRFSGGKNMSTHPVCLPGKIHGLSKPGGLQSMGSWRVRHDLATKPPPPTYHCLCNMYF